MKGKKHNEIVVKLDNHIDISKTNSETDTQIQPNGKKEQVNKKKLVNKNEMVVNIDSYYAKNNSIKNTIKSSDQKITLLNSVQRQTSMDLKNNMFQFEGKKLIYLVIKINDDPFDDKILFKGPSAGDALGYEKPHDAISRLVKEKNKISYKNLLEKYGCRVSQHLGKIDGQTMFIDEPGFYKLISRSRLPEAERFSDWIFEEVLPSIRKYGSYSTPMKQYQTLTFYSAHQVSDYDNKNVIYIGCIGMHNGELLHKFGKSGQVYSRDFEQHQKIFECFGMVHIELCDNKDVVELLFKKELKAK